MQNTISALPNNEIEAGKQLEEALRALPQELLGVLPESVWLNLTLDQKKEILRQHNLLEKYSSVEQNQAQEVIEVRETVEAKPDVVVEKVQSVEEIRSPEFAQALERAEEVEKEAKVQDLTAEAQQRIEEETAANQNTGKSSWSSRIFGYSVSDNTANNAENLSAKGSPEDGMTWAATLIRKILAVLGQ